MAKRNKTKKLFKSNLKLEALEQRQLLAGITGSGTELTPGGAGANNFIVASNGNHYDQVLLTGTSVSVTNDVGNITRVSFLDLQGDIVQAEFGGAGTLTISLDPTTALAAQAPTKYNQTLAQGYEQGLASFSIQGSDSTTNFTVFSVGAGTAFAGNTLFDSTHTGGNNTADIQRLTIVANPANPNGSTFGGIRAGNAIFGAASGVVGISAANVQVQDVVTIGDIKATGTATPTLVFGTQSQFVNVTLAGGGLVEANGASINNTDSYKFGLTFAAGADSTVLPNGTPNLAQQTAPAGLSFTGDNPVAAQIKTFTLTTGVDTIVGTSGNDSITGQIGGGSPTLTALDSIDGGAGVNALTINDVAGGATIPGGVTIKNIQTLNLASAAAAGAVGAGNSFDISGLTGLTALNVVQSKGADFITAGSTQAVTVFDTAGVVTVTGGATQAVTTAGGLALSGAAGAITATDTAQGTVISAIDGGTAVTLTNTATATGTTSTGAINIGGTKLPTGAIVVTNNLSGDATFAGAVTGGLITTKGGTTVSVTQTATSPVNPAAAANQVLTQAAVSVTGGTATTGVTVLQAPTVNGTPTVIAVPAATEVDAVTFGPMGAGDTLTVGGLSYVAPVGGATAAQVASAFASLGSTALSSFTSGPVSGAGSNVVTFTATGTGATKVPVLGSGTKLSDTLVFQNIAASTNITILGSTYGDPGTGTTGAALAALYANSSYTSGGQTWTSGPASGATVVFTATAAADTKIVPTGTGALPAVTEVTTAASISQTVVGAASTGAAGRGGVTEGAVTIADGAGATNTISTVSLSNYGNSTINSNALNSLSLTNTGSSSSGVSGSTGTLGITNTVATSLDLTLNGGSQGSLGTITAPTYTAIKAHVTGSDTSATITASALTALTVDGTKKLSLTASGLTALTSVTVSGSASFSSSTLPTTVGDVNASATSGAMTVTLPVAATTYEGGSGADNVTIGNLPTVAISGGAGTDTLTVATTAVPNPSAVTLISGFETLAPGANSLSLDATGFTGLSNNKTGSVFTNVANGTALSSSGGDVTYTLKTPTGTDTLAISASGTSTVTVAAVGGVTIPTVTVAGSSSGATNLTLADAGVTSILVTNGNSTRGVTLTTTGDTALTTVDASAMGNATFTYTAAGTVAETVKGGAGNDVLSASSGTVGDTLIGGLGNDTLKANTGLDVLSGGSGANTFVIAGQGANLNTYSSITDAKAGDVLQLKNFGNEVFNATKVTLQNTAVFQDYANTVVTAAGDASTNAGLGWFQFNGDTYIVESMHNNATTPGFKDGADLVVKLQGLVDLSNSTLLQSSSGVPELVIR